MHKRKKTSRVMTGETPKRILEVEDHQDIAALMALALTGIGYHVETVGTCKEGVEAIQEDRFDLYIFDNLLPDGTGIELCREVRIRDENTPIINYRRCKD